MSRSTKLLEFWLALALALAASVHAQTAPAPAAPGSTPPAESARKWPLARGEVLEVDRKEQRVTVKHGPIRNLGMDAMTMEFLVPDAKLLASLKPGDKVRFAAVYKGGDYVITRADVVKRRVSSRRPPARTPP